MTRIQYAGLVVACFFGSLVAGLLFDTDSKIDARAKDAEFATVQVRRLTLVDKAGTTKADLFPTKEGGSALILYDDHGNHRLSLSTIADGSPEVSLYDASGKTRAQIGLDQKAWPMLLLNDREENAVWMAPGYRPAAKDEKPLSEKQRWELLRKGMTQRQVLEILGNPQLASFSGTKGLRWHWGVRSFGAEIQSDGWVSFELAALKTWSSPYDSK